MEEFVVSELVTSDQFSTRFEALEVKLDAKLDTLSAELKSELAALRAELKTDIAAVETRVVRWVVGSIGGATLAMVLTLLRAVK
jgi:hypothetical protein